jgi:hypothetical protein
VTRFRDEFWVWAIVGAVGGVVGPTAPSSLAWFVLMTMGLAVPVAVAVVVGLLVWAVAVRRRGGMIAARVWAAVAWVILSGGLLAAAMGTLNNVPVSPVWYALVAVYWVAWFLCSGALAALLFAIGRRLARAPSGAGVFRPLPR